MESTFAKNEIEKAVPLSIFCSLRFSSCPEAISTLKQLGLGRRAVGQIWMRFGERGVRFGDEIWEKGD